MIYQRKIYHIDIEYFKGQNNFYKVAQEHIEILGHFLHYYTHLNVHNWVTVLAE